MSGRYAPLVTAGDSLTIDGLPEVWLAFSGIDKINLEGGAEVNHCSHGLAACPQVLGMAPRVSQTPQPRNELADDLLHSKSGNRLKKRLGTIRCCLPRRIHYDVYVVRRNV